MNGGEYLSKPSQGLWTHMPIRIMKYYKHDGFVKHCSHFRRPLTGIHRFCRGTMGEQKGAFSRPPFPASRSCPFLPRVTPVIPGRNKKSPLPYGRGPFYFPVSKRS